MDGVIDLTDDTTRLPGNTQDGGNHQDEDVATTTNTNSSNDSNDASKAITTTTTPDRPPKRRGRPPNRYKPEHHFGGDDVSEDAHDNSNSNADVNDNSIMDLTGNEGTNNGSGKRSRKSGAASAKRSLTPRRSSSNSNSNSNTTTGTANNNNNDNNNNNNNIKRSRHSARLAAAKSSSDGNNNKNEQKEEEEDDTPEYVHSKNDYYEVDEILDRRMRRFGMESGGRHVVEYLVSWKKNGEEEHEPSWLIAENLDQNSLAEAFRMFPTDADPDRSTLPSVVSEDPTPLLNSNQDKGQYHHQPNNESSLDCLLDIEFSDDDDDEEEGIMDTTDEFVSPNAKSSDDDEIAEYYDPEDDDNDLTKDSNYNKDTTLQNEISHLGESDYDTPGSVELIVNRKCYRVGQSFYGSAGGSGNSSSNSSGGGGSGSGGSSSEKGNKKYIYTISTILPKTRQAKCHKCMRMEDTFVCPRGGEMTKTTTTKATMMEGSYIQLKEEVILDLSSLKVPVKEVVKKVMGWRYYEEDERQRSFCYYIEGGRILYHPLGRPAALDLFAGAGGQSIGLKNAGFDVKWVVDNDHLAAATYRANNASHPVQIYAEDVKAFLKKSIQEHPCYPKVGEVDHIHASPPCKGFSRANRNGGKNDLMNNKQTLLFIKAIQHFQPKTATFENVPGLVLDDYKPYLQSVASNLLSMSYQVQVQVLGSHSYGDPQRRRRLILWAARKDCMMPSIPKPTHGPGLLPIKTAKDALQSLEKFDPVSSGSSGSVFLHGRIIYNHITPRFKLDMNSDDYALAEDEPSRTVLARARPHLHYSGNRFISVREAACLQSFPPTYQFFGSLGSQYSQVGNAVPVGLATAIAKSVAIVHGCPT